MWNCVPDFPDPIGPIVEIIQSIRSYIRAEEAAKEAAMWWSSLFWIAVIVIAVLAFLIYKKSHNTPAKS